MQPELFVFPISPEAQARLNRIALRGALDSAIDMMTDLRKLPGGEYPQIKAMGFALAGMLDLEEKTLWEERHIRERAA